jgi:glycosyltransferase involved in cell wall biosynthesis
MPRAVSSALTPLRTLAGDVARFRAGRTYKNGVLGLMPSDNVETLFVWSHHDLFHDAPMRLGRQLGVPLLAYVHAPIVWEAARWGVRRPGWGSLLERFAEAPNLRRADLVACASDDVRDAVLHLGIPSDRTIVAPMAVDADRFSPLVDGATIRRTMGVDDRFVIGWVGSFRRFHGIDLAVDALVRLRSTVPEAVLMLVGDGFERASIEQHVNQLGLSAAVHFVGQVGNESLPQYLRAFDVAVVTAREGQSFHYSPLKLREYMAAGLPVVVPRIGEMGRIFDDGKDALLYPPGDADALARQLATIHSDRQLAGRLGAAARAFVLDGSTWDNRLSQVCDALGVGSSQ